MFDDYVKRWALTANGAPVITRNSRLLPVRHAGAPAMLKIATAEEERRGASLMVWWNGEGTARVLAHDGDALLLERATGDRSLGAMARESSAGDDEASRIMCAVAAKLHAPRPSPPATLIPLARWFASLEPAADRRGGVLRDARSVVHALLAEPRDVVVLHGDIHHGNVLDGGSRGWLAIDPKGLVGERGFDFANILCNPDLDMATAPGRLARQVTVISEAAGLDRARLLLWILAYAGVSAAWSIEDEEDPALALRVAQLARAELSQS